MKYLKQPWCLFIPFLFLYVIIAIKFHNANLEGDEARYVSFAKNLLHGFYSPPMPNINLWNGPGYPIIIAPFLALNLPMLAITMMNAVFQYLSVLLLFIALKHVVNYKMALIISLFWGMYYPAFVLINMIYTESFSMFLISALLLCIVKAMGERYSMKYLILGGFVLGFLALTKVVFGFVLLIMLLLYAALWLLNRHKIFYKKATLILLFAGITVVPYLVYTYHLTGKVFYWGNSGGMSLYWMSTLDKQEFGDWKDVDLIESGKQETDLTLRPDEFAQLKLNHQSDFDQILKFKGTQRDDAFKKIAIQNIKRKPFKFIKNCFANIGRLLFDFPYSYKYEGIGTLLKMPPVIIAVLLMLFSIIPTIINWRKIPSGIQFVVLLLFLYLGESVLLSAYSRQFYIIVPMILFWTAYVFQKIVKIKLQFDEVN
jgi:hypothetical protein